MHDYVIIKYKIHYPKAKCTIIVDNNCALGSVTDYTDKISVA